MPDEDNGIVLRLSDGKYSFLLTSDISQEAELDLITRRAILRARYLRSVTTAPIIPAGIGLAVVDPKLAVISVGADNEYGHPGAETMERLTDKVGME